MHKTATPQDVQSELRNILAYCATEQPSRAVVAARLQALADRVAFLNKWQQEMLSTLAFLKAQKKVTPTEASAIREAISSGDRKKAEAAFGEHKDMLL